MNPVHLLELNIGLGLDAAVASKKIATVTNWLHYRTPHPMRMGGSGHEVFTLRLYRPNSTKEGMEFMLAVRTLYSCTRGLEDFDNLCRLLHEECVAVYNVDARTGYLIGPKRLAWGNFDLKKFTRIN